jgi:hypothetical protein
LIIISIPICQKEKKIFKSDYSEKIKFLAVGIDAHHIEEVGTCVTIGADPVISFSQICPYYFLEIC